MVEVVQCSLDPDGQEKKSSSKDDEVALIPATKFRIVGMITDRGGNTQNNEFVREQIRRQLAAEIGSLTGRQVELDKINQTVRPDSTSLLYVTDKNLGNRSRNRRSSEEQVQGTFCQFELSWYQHRDDLAKPVEGEGDQ